MSTLHFLPSTCRPCIFLHAVSESRARGARSCPDTLQTMTFTPGTDRGRRWRLLSGQPCDHRVRHAGGAGEKGRPRSGALTNPRKPRKIAIRGGRCPWITGKQRIARWLAVLLWAGHSPLSSSATHRCAPRQPSRQRHLPHPPRSKRPGREHPPKRKCASSDSA